MPAVPWTTTPTKDKEPTMTATKHDENWKTATLAQRNLIADFLASLGGTGEMAHEYRRKRGDGAKTTLSEFAFIAVDEAADCETMPDPIFDALYEDGALMTEVLDLITTRILSVS